MPEALAQVLPWLVACLTALLATPLVARLATARGLVDRPNRDRWHQKPTARLGGIAIFAGWQAGFACLLAMQPDLAAGRPAVWAFGAATGLMFLLGLWDDLKTIRPLPKFIGQGLAVGILVAAGVQVDFLPPGWLNVAVTAFWLLGVTNALNLVDNMNGLCAGITAIAASAYALYATWLYPQPLVATLAALLVLACVGFLPYNARYRKQALIFMGDCGSMFLGFSLAALGLMGRWQGDGALTLGILLPILILAVPLFDTTLAICARKLEDRPVSRGGRDHFSHRLVYFGLSEKQAVASLWLLGSAFSLLAWPLSWGHHWLLIVAVVPPLAVSLYTLGVFLSTLRQPRQKVPRPWRMRAFQLGEVTPLMVAQDLLLVLAAWSASLLLDTAGHPDPASLGALSTAVPLVGVLVVGTFAVAGIYRRPWPGNSAQDSLLLGGLVLGAHILAGVVLAALRHPLGGHADMMAFATVLCYLLIKADRHAVPLWREVFSLWPLHRPALRVAIAGGETTGLATLQRLDPKGVDVVRILPATGIEEALAETDPELVLLAEGESPEARHRVVEACLATGYSWLPAPS